MKRSRMKKLFISIMFFFSLSISCFASNNWSSDTSCPLALPSTDPNFCSSFLAVGTCHCLERLPTKYCQSLKDIYANMIATFGTMEAACAWQKDVDTQTCIDDWNCARKGGRNSRGGLCSSTGNPCQL